MNRRRCAAFTWVEAIVSLSIICVLALLALPAITTTTCGRSPMTQALSNMRQLHLATQTMALDGTTTGDTNLGWPADTGGTFDRWAQVVTGSNYLTTNDLCKLLSAPGKQVSTKRLPRKEDAAFLLYSVGETNDGSFVFLTTANFTNTPKGGVALNSDAVPFGSKGFVVFRKGGDGAILLPNQVTNTNLIGSYVPLCK